MGWLKKVAEIVLELFRKKQYYIIEYDLLNDFDIEFREFSYSIFQRIKEILQKYNFAEKIDDKKNELFKEDSVEIVNIDDLNQIIKKIVSKDFKSTYFEAINEGWDFNYFLTSGGKIYKDTLLISNRITSKDRKTGDVIYPIIAIKKYSKKFYLWDLTD